MFKVGDKVVIVEQREDSGIMFSLGDESVILETHHVERDSYRLRTPSGSTWWVNGKCLELLDFNLENI